MTIKAKKSKINLREKLAELLNFRQIRDRLDGLGLYLGKDRTGTAENLAVRGGANVDDLQLAEISAAVGGTAVDVFVYDTRNDSDGGKWRERTSSTSWYNEELNTATRGGRREFPAVAVIVAESNKVTIYDGDDPDLSMWMVFEGQYDADLQNCKLLTWASNPGQITSCSFLNGLLGIGTGDNGGLIAINFVKDFSRYYREDGSSYTGAIYSGDISTRNTTSYSWVGDYDELSIVNDYVNDVAMTVLPNAPIDSETGLPIPTIAVACGSSSNGGFSIINHDGTIASKSYTESAINQSVSFTYDNKLVVSQKRNSNGDVWVAIYDDLTTSTSTSGIIVHDGNISVKYNDTNWLNLPNILSGTTGTIENKYIMSDNGLTLFDQYESYIGSYVDGNPVNIHGMVAYTTSSYNTGWMPGDIKLATLSDTKIQKVGVDETTSLIENATDWTGASGTPSSTLPTGWTMNSSYSSLVSVAGGELTLKEDNTNDYGIILQSFPVEAGKTYTLKARFKANAGSARVWIGTSASGGTDDVVNIFQNATSTYTEISHTFSHDTTGNVKVSIAAQGAGAEAVFDYVSITETGELITNGTFDTDSDWTKEAGWTIGGGVASVNNTSGDFSSVQTFPVVEAGKYYVFTADVTTISAGSILLTYQTGSGYANIQAVSSIGISRDSSAGPGPLVRYFRADTSGVSLLSIAASNGAIASVDNASFREIEFDRSVNNRGLKIFGEIDKTPVAPGADLVAYSGFSADDYLMQPYNSDLDFGTGDFCVMIWLKFTKNDAYDGIISKANSWLIDTGLNNSIFFKFWNGSTYQSSVSVDGDSVYGVWRCLCVKRESNVLSLFLDGVEKTDPSNPYSNSTDFSSEFGLLVGSGPGSPANDTLISLVRVSKTAPTPEQIAKIYRDEKVLFQDGAQATLYGTSDAVTALAYDDKTELLHVGTSGGRSDFAGLRRINNTTTAVTTSISASNNLIAEQ